MSRGEGGGGYLLRGRESVNFNFLAHLNLVTTDVKFVSSNEGMVVSSQSMEKKLVGEV